MVRKKGKYKLSELHKKIGKLTAEGTVKGERVAVEAPQPQLPPSFLLHLLFFHTKEPSSRLVVQTGRLSKYPTFPPP